jgi:hypothetical protein
VLELFHCQNRVTDEEIEDNSVDSDQKLQKEAQEP